MVTINGKWLGTDADDDLLRELLKTVTEQRPDTHNGDDNIDSTEAVSLFDLNRDGIVGNREVAGLKGWVGKTTEFSSQRFLDCIELFKKHGFTIPTDPNNPLSVKEIAKETIHSALDDYLNGYRRAMGRIFSAIDDIPDGSLTKNELWTIWRFRSLRNFDKNPNAAEGLVKTLLPKLATGALTDLESVHHLAWLPATRETKMAFLDIVNPNQPAVRPVMELIIDLVDKRLTDENELRARINALPDGAVNHFDTALTAVDHINEAFPASLALLASKVSNDLLCSNEQVSQIFGDDRDRQEHEDEVVDFFQAKTGPKLYWNYRARVCLRRFKETELATAVKAIPDGAVTDEGVATKLVTGLEGFPDQQNMALKKSTDKKIDSLWNYLALINSLPKELRDGVTLNSPIIDGDNLRWAFDRLKGDTKQQMYILSRFEGSINNHQELNQLLFPTRDNPALQALILKKYQGSLTSIGELCSLLWKTSNSESLQGDLIGVYFKGEFKTGADYIDVIANIPAGHTGLLTSIFNKIPDGFLVIENPADFLCRFDPSLYPLIGRKISPASWRAFFAEPENTMGYFGSRRLWDTIETGGYGGRESPLAIQLKKYSPAVFYDVVNYINEFKFNDEIKTLVDLETTLAQIPEVSDEEKARIVSLWGEVKEKRPALQRYLAGMLEPDIVATDDYFAKLNTQLEEGKRYIAQTPAFLTALCFKLPIERFRDKNFISHLFAMVRESHCDELAQALTGLVDVSLEEKHGELSRSVFTDQDLSNFWYTNAYPKLQEAYLKNLEPQSVVADSNLKEWLASAPTLQSKILDLVFDMTAQNIANILPVLTDTAALHLVDIFYGNITKDNGLYRPNNGPNPHVYRLDARHGRDLIKVFSANTKAQAYLIERLLPALPCFGMDGLQMKQCLDSAALGKSLFERISPSHLAKALQAMVNSIPRDRGYYGYEDEHSLKLISNFFKRVPPEKITEARVDDYTAPFAVGIGLLKMNDLFKLIDSAFTQDTWARLEKGGYAAVKGYWELILHAATVVSRSDYQYGNYYDLAQWLATSHNDDLWDESFRGYVNAVVEDTKNGALDFLKFVSPQIIKEGLDIHNADQVREVCRRFNVIRADLGDLSDSFMSGMNRFVAVYPMPLLDALELFANFKVAKDEALIRFVESEFPKKGANTAPLKIVLGLLDATSNNALLRFGAAVDWTKVFSSWQNVSVEEKVIAAQVVLSYLKVDLNKLTAALNLTKADVDAYLTTETAKPQAKLSDYYYILTGYKLTGSQENIAAMIKKIDLSRLARESMSLEVFGVLEELGVSLEVWERIITDFPANLLEIGLIEQMRQKLLGISKEKANQFVEIKAQGYVEGPITKDAIPKKIKFVQIWSNPQRHGAEIPWNADTRYVYDIYIQAALRQKNAIKQFCMQNEFCCDDIGSWNIFDEQEIRDINAAQAAIKAAIEINKTTPAVKEKKQSTHVKEEPKTQPAPQKADDKPIQEIMPDPQTQLLQALEDYALRQSTSPEIVGRITTREQLNARLVLYSEYEKRGLADLMNLIREQVVSWVNRNISQYEDLMGETIRWNETETDLGDVLKLMGIEYLETGTGVGTKLKKGIVGLFTNPLYVKTRATQEYETENINLKIPAVVSAGLNFEPGFSGGEARFEDTDGAAITDQAVHPCASLFTIKRGGPVEAIVEKFDPKKGARFDFLVQVGATTGGNMADLANILKGRRGNNLMLDTVGAMVQGEGMPISMIFEYGEPKNKKTTMEGERDGLVVFSPAGRLAIVNKTRINYYEMAQVVSLGKFKDALDKEIKETAAHLITKCGDLSKCTAGEIALLEPKEFKKYQELLEMRELFEQWKDGKPLNYASEQSYLPQKLFWKIAKFGRLSGFIESLFVENGSSTVKKNKSGAHRRLLLKFSDNTYGIYDSRKPMYEIDVARAVAGININGVTVTRAVNLDTGMADDTRIHTKDGGSIQIGYTSQPVGTNRIGVYYKEQK
ncbi:MAG: hypothetical protein HQM16_07185 [Deltaproteobacteria bacterium]|nr:hypothetical protein [Deltaproteobacteria bacterium]